MPSMDEIKMEKPEVLPNDHPTVQKLLSLEEKYRTLEKEYQKQIAKLTAEYSEKQQPLLDERAKVVSEDIPNFWLSVLANCPAIEDEIKPHDVPLLNHVTNITSDYLEDPTGLNQAGFKITVHFSENEYFTNEKLVRIFETGVDNETTMSISVQSVRMEEEIEWKAGKDITVEMKKVKAGKKAGKKAADKVQKVPREGFFRTFFRTLDPAEPDTFKDLLDKCLREMGADMEDIDDEEMEGAYEEAMEKVIDDAYEIACNMQEALVPYAASFYTGDAVPDEPEFDMDDDDEDDDEDDEDESDDDGEDSDDDGPKVKQDKPSKAQKNIFENAPEAGEKAKNEECKQQ